VDAWWFLPFLISAVLIGLPHGAADWGVLRRLVGRESRPTACVCVLIYSLLLVASACAVFLIPALGLGIFLLVSAWHFGGGDSHDFQNQFGLKKRKGLLIIVAASRGTLIVTAPFLFRFGDMFGICESWCVILGAGWIPSHLSDAFETALQVVFGLAAALAAVSILWILFSGGRKPAVWLALETVLLLASFSLLHPLFALGSYFLCWHSLRHLTHLRILCDVGRRSGWLLRLSGPFMLPSLLAIVALGWGTGSLKSPEQGAIILLIFFAIVTPAHQWLVSREIQSPSPA
tara:strand:- start:5748 stop:6614 length:867 start_codon:yes stop_codon:yes gene_type:complete